MSRTIRFTFSRTVTLDPLWFDEQWLVDMLGDGLSEEEALREMLRVGYEEDWTSLMEAVLGVIGRDKLQVARAMAFADSCTDMQVVDAGFVGQAQANVSSENQNRDTLKGRKAWRTE